MLKLRLKPYHKPVLGELSRPVITGSTTGQAEHTKVLLGLFQRKPKKKGNHQMCAGKGILYVLHEVLNSVIDFMIMKRWQCPRA